MDLTLSELRTLRDFAEDNVVRVTRNYFSGHGEFTDMVEAEKLVVKLSDAVAKQAANIEAITTAIFK